MRTSAEGLVAIMAHEALWLEAYDDGVGVWTIGVGHTAAAGEPKPHKGLTISFERAIEIFLDDIAGAEDAVERAVTVELSQNQFDALVSWELNLGRIGDASVTMITLLNKGDFAGAADQLLVWNKAGGKVSRGLQKRRAAELAMFLNGDYGTDPITFKEAGRPKRALPRAEILAMVEAELGMQAHLKSAARPGTNSGVSGPAGKAALQDYPANPQSAILPRMRPRQSVADSRAVLEAYKNLLPPGRHDDAVVLLAVRGYYDDSFGMPDVNDRGFYDDAIFVIEPDHVHNFNGNTDPSIRRNGIATLVAPQAVLYKPGYHGYQSAYGHQAFRQASAVTVSRDGGSEESDRGRSPFWINLHRGGNTRTSSEGCQTVPPSQWPEFKPLVDGLLRQYRQDDVCYLLITEEQRAKALEYPRAPMGQVIGRIGVNKPPGGAPVQPPAGELVLRRDDMAAPSARVSALQTALRALGYELGKIDGRFGSLTEGAILAFQADNKVPTTGEFDAATQAMLDKGPMRPLGRDRTGASEADVIAAGSSTVRNAANSRILSWITTGFGALGVGNSAVINAAVPTSQPTSAVLALLEDVSQLGVGTQSTETLRRLAESARAIKDGAASSAPELLQALVKLRGALPADALAGAPEIDRAIGIMTRAGGLKPQGMGTIFDILPGFFADGTVLQSVMKGVALTASSTLPGFAGSAALVAAGLAGRILANRIAEARVKDHREGKNLGN